MQHGSVVLFGDGCAATNSGQHQVEDWCRQCGCATGLQKAIDALTTERDAACTWKYDETHCKWDTNCKRAFIFTDGTPLENGFKHCPFCGGHIHPEPTEAAKAEGNE